MTKSKKVLCIEDNVDCGELLRMILNNEGFESMICSDSEKALQLAKQGKFSAIILDHRLDEVSGVEICRQIRAYDQQTPIIFYSAAAFPEEKKAGLAAGANAYLVKPNDTEKIAETVTRLVL
jgi:DNA-binding response OmpR family regulator